MKFDEPLDDLIGGRVSVRVIRQFCLFPTKEFTGREMARVAGVSHSKAIKILNDLYAHGLVERRSVGASQLWRFQREHVLASQLRSLFQFEAGLKDRLTKQLHAGLEKIPYVNYAALFGSTARGESKPESDMDVLVVVKSWRDKERFSEQFGQTRRNIEKRFGSRIQPIVFSVAEWKRKKGSPVVKNIEREGITVVERG